MLKNNIPFMKNVLTVLIFLCSIVKKLTRLFLVGMFKVTANIFKKKYIF